MRGRARACTLGAAVVIAACTGPATPVADAPSAAPPAASEPVPGPAVQGGTIRLSLPGPLTTADPWSTEATGTTAAAVRPVLSSLWRVTADGGREPALLAGEPEVTVAADGRTTAVYELRPDAVWSDGRPLDARDVLFTVEVCQRAGTAAPCAAVDPVASRAEGGRATLVFGEPVSGWRAPFGDRPVLPAHAFGGPDDVVASWSERPLLSSGPFRTVARVGDIIVYAVNERWWGARPPIDRLEIATGSGAGIADVRAGAADVAWVDATVANLELARAAGLRVAVAPGAAWTVLDFDTTAPAVADPAVRRALSAAIDVEAVVDELIHPVAPATRPRGGLLIPDADTATEQPTDARTMLADAGCDVGAGQRATTCGGAPLELRVASDGSDPRHAVLGEYLAAQLGRLGVAVTPTGGDRGELHLATVTAGDGTAVGTRWRCDDDARWPAWCDPELDRLLDRAERAPDDDERADAVAAAEARLVRERPSAPLYPVPTMLVHRPDVGGPGRTARVSDVTWDIGVWTRTEASQQDPATTADE